MDALEALGDDGLYAEQEGALRRPVARGARAVLLAGEDEERHALLLVLQAGLVDRGLLAVREVDCVAALLAPGELVAQADVAEGAAHHDLVVAATAPVGVEVAGVYALLDQVLPGRHLRGDRAGRRDVVRRHRVPDLHQDARPFDVLEVLRVGTHVLEEGGLLDVGRVGVPLVEVALGDLHVVPLLVAGVDVGVLLSVDLRVQGVVDLPGHLLLRRPHVLEVDGVALAILAQRVLREVYVHRAGQGVGDDERRGGEVVGPHVRVDAALEVTVAREDGGDHEVVLVDRLGDLLGERAGVPDARRAPVADHVEVELLQRVEEPGGLEVLRDDLGPGREARLDVRRDREAPLAGLLRQKPRAHHHRRVRGVGAAGYGGDDGGAVGEV